MQYVNETTLWLPAVNQSYDPHATEKLEVFRCPSVAPTEQPTQKLAAGAKREAQTDSRHPLLILLLFVAIKLHFAGDSDGSTGLLPSPALPILLQQRLSGCVNDVVSRFGETRYNYVRWLFMLPLVGGSIAFLLTVWAWFALLASFVKR